MARYTTEQGEAALEEFGFSLVELDAVGAPTPGRIADRLSDIDVKLEAAILRRDDDGIRSALSELRRLRLALDAWDCGMLRKHHDGQGKP